jgi:hypothetical protein
MKSSFTHLIPKINENSLRFLKIYKKWDFVPGPNYYYDYLKNIINNKLFVQIESIIELPSFLLIVQEYVRSRTLYNLIYESEERENLLNE